jgi:restriction system protein
VIASMNPAEFEHVAAFLFSQMGFDVTVTPYQNDGGADCYFGLADEMCGLLQVKHRIDGEVWLDVLKAALAVARKQRLEEAVILTSGRFRRDAWDFAQRRAKSGSSPELQIWHGEQVASLIAELSDGELRAMIRAVRTNAGNLRTVTYPGVPDPPE